MTTPRKADRFERIADKQYHHWEAAVTPLRIAELLRREHAATVRMVKEEAAKVANDKGLSGDGDLVENILRRLAKRKG